VAGISGRMRSQRVSGTSSLAMASRYRATKPWAKFC
jgi:hypothetical protein